jgi:NADH-quinone oxidoreductase subunit L
MSQIGYMIVGVGVGAYEGGVAHFFTHAFFKAQLFLAAGLIIHALGNEQDVRRMGGLRTKMPFAFWAILTGVLSICGIPGFSGFFSKDQVIYGALLHGHPWIYSACVVTAGLTAYYMFRLLFVTFWGEYRGNAERAGSHGHDAPAWIMNVPVGILIVPTVAIGAVLLYGESSPWARYFAPQFGGRALTPPPISEPATSGIVLLFVLAGLAVAWMRYATKSAQANAVDRLRVEAERTPAFLINLFYFDTIIDLVFVRTSQLFGMLAARIVDPHLIDGAVRELATIARNTGTLVRSLQTGLVRAYALILAFGAALFIAYYAFAAGGPH